MTVVSKASITEKFFSLGRSETEDRLRKAETYLGELGRTYHLSRAELSPGRAQIDPYPLILDESEVQHLKQGADQWGRFLDRLYADLYGPQQLVAAGQLSEAALWRHPAWEPARHGLLPPNRAGVSLFRLDLTLQNGVWKTLEVEAGIPRGLGYALENRIVHFRYFGSLIDQKNLTRLAPFFQGLKHLWMRSSPFVRDVPSVAFWTEGPSDPDYFEPVYLARYFGYPLVESRDLTVRSGRVFIKTIGGLQPVDVLIRWLDDRLLDPLSGNPGALQGVPGLLEAVRSGGVCLTNGPGSGLLSSPALWHEPERAFQAALNEEALLPRVSETEAWDPLPFWGEGQSQGAPFRLRLFAARLERTWQLMPGGLIQGENFAGAKKDVWWLSSREVPQVSLLPSMERPLEITRLSELPSRIADDLSWLGRYAERAWFDLRLLEKWQEGHQGGLAEQDALAFLFLEKLFAGLSLAPEGARALEPSQLWTNLEQTVNEMQRVSGQVLDRLSLETHRILRTTGEWIRKPRGAAPETVVAELSLRLAAFNGLTQENMTRGPGWRFLDIGKRLERAELLVETLATFFNTENHEGNLPLLLELFDSTITYRTRYRLSPQLAPVLDLLLLDEANPRSLAFQVVQLNSHIELLPRPSARAYRSTEERSILELLTALRLIEPMTLKPEDLTALFDQFRRLLQSLDRAVHERYFAQIFSMESLQARTGDLLG